MQSLLLCPIGTSTAFDSACHKTTFQPLVAQPEQAMQRTHAPTRTQVGHTGTVSRNAKPESTSVTHLRHLVPENCSMLMSASASTETRPTGRHVSASLPHQIMQFSSRNSAVPDEFMCNAGIPFWDYARALEQRRASGCRVVLICPMLCARTGQITEASRCNAVHGAHFGALAELHSIFASRSCTDIR